MEQEKIAIQENSRILRNEQRREAAVVFLKKGIWLYLLLVIFEGALRKWFFPRLANPLLVVRDPLVIWMLFVAWKNDLLPSNLYIKAMVLLGIAGFLVAIILGHGNVFVAAFGARILVLHFPFMFLIGKLFTADDVLKTGRAMLWLSLPMICLIAVQFYSPQSAFVNRGIGGDVAGAGFAGAQGYFRPPGTFSFTTGNTQFFCLTAVFVLYFWLEPRRVNKLLLILSTFALAASIPFSISRTLFFQVVLSLLFGFVVFIRKPQYRLKAIFGVIVVVVLALQMTKLPLFGDAVSALTTRYSTANEAEGGLSGVIGQRFLGNMLLAITSSGDSFFGYGIGMGTNVGSRLLIGRADYFLIAEQEWPRIVGEMGTVMGLGVILVRVAVSWRILASGFRRLKTGGILPWILASWAVITVATIQWGQPTGLGFSTLIGGFAIAALKRNENEV